MENRIIGDMEGIVQHQNSTKDELSLVSSTSSVRDISSNNVAKINGYKIFMDKRPAIWASDKQPLCESVEYFDSYYSRIYTKNNELIAIYINNNAILEIFNFDVIVSHCAGSMSENEDGIYVPSKDQLDNNRYVQLFIKCFENKTPLVVIIGDKSNPISFRNKYKLIVMGYYIIAHMWDEYQEGTAKVNSKKRGHNSNYKLTNPTFLKKKYRLERIKDQKYPVWWEQEECPDIYEHECEIKIKNCFNCKKSSPIIYDMMFFCFNKDCKYFNKVNIDGSFESITNLKEELEFSPCFLRRCINSYPDIGTTKLKSLFPKLNSNTLLDTPDLEYKVPNGVHCLKCGKLGLREEWKRWTCSNCLHAIDLKLKHIKLPTLKQSLSFEQYNKNIYKETVNSIEGWVKHIYYVPSQRFTPLLYKIEHYKPNKENYEKFEKYFEGLQREDIPLKRFPFKKEYGRGRFLCNQFQYHIGEHYDYKSNIQTVPLSNTTAFIREYFYFISKELKYDSFNQSSIILYMADQSMNWHSDNENKIKGKVASLSLGSNAIMSFRLKKAGKKKYSTCLDINLNHGDILIMDDNNFQSDYEHKVTPNGFRLAQVFRSLEEDKAN